MSRIRVKIGAAEVEYEGKEDYMKDELINLVTELSSALTRTSPVSESEAPTSEPFELSPSNGSPAIDMSVESIAAKLDVKKGTDLLVAAAAHLSLVDQQTSFTRKEILDEMKKASSYYTQNMASNFSGYLKTAIKSGILIQRSNNSYALTANTKKSLAERLAD